MTIKEKIQEWQGENRQLMVLKYDELGHRASGQWEKSLTEDVTENNGQYHGKTEAFDYTYYIEHGRKPGKFPPISAIRKWIEDKGIIAQGISKNSLAYLIARKIAREGTELRPGIVSDVITEERIQDLIKAVGDIMVGDVKSEVINTFN